MNLSRWLFGVVSLSALTAVLFLWSSQSSLESIAATASLSSTKSTGERPAGSRPATLVVTRTVSSALINDRLISVGSGVAKASVTVVPLSDGVLTKVLATSGIEVSKGAVVARLDDAEELIVRDRAVQALQKATDDLKRIEALFKTRTTTQVEVTNARSDFDDARLALRQAELHLSRRVIVAPIGGRVGIVSVEAGNYVTTQTAIVTIDDRSEIQVEFWIPERFVSAVRVGQELQAKAFSMPGQRLIGSVSAVGSRVEPDSRTLPVRAVINNGDDRLRPGMSFELTLSFPGERFRAIDPLAVQWDSQGSYAWQILDSKAVRVPIRIVQRNRDSVLVDSSLVDGDEVVTEGVLSVRAGAKVRSAEKPEVSPKQNDSAATGDQITVAGAIDRKT